MIDKLKPFVDLVKIPALKYTVPENLILAIIWQESAGNIWAYRYEPQVAYLYSPSVFAKKNCITFDTEVVSQKTSWGLMQVMGFKARELGFDGPLTQLLLPSVALDCGTKALSLFMAKYTNRDDAIASYNAGSPRLKDGKYQNQAYVDSVKQHLADIEH